MEDSSRFDLEAAIGSWQKQFAGSAISKENLSELEAHLREAFDNGRKSGFSDEEAFAIASYRLGSGRSLAAEFAQAHPERIWLDRILWMLLGAQFVSFLTQIADLLRGLISLPRLLSDFPRAIGDSGVLWTSLLWNSQYLILAGLLFATFKVLQNRHRLSEDVVEALRRNPGKWCASFVAISLSLGAVSFIVMILPSLIRSWIDSTHSTHYEYPNLLLMFVAYALHATLLPAVTFWFIRQQFPPARA
jgi:hypothetical protein